jgi:menaquinone-dependent protoporphyrinogen IX oxidase
MIEMAVLVAYASKHGATHEIAERIAQTLTAAGSGQRAAGAGALGISGG